MKTKAIVNLWPISHAMEKPSTRYPALFGICMLALLVRILYLVFVSGLATAPRYDEISYDLMAQNIVTV